MTMYVEMYTYVLQYLRSKWPITKIVSTLQPMYTYV